MDEALQDWYVLNPDSIGKRASSLNSAEPRAFLRWAGSKRWLLKEIITLLPDKFGTYYEPFLGGASLFFLLCPDKAYLNDKSEELIKVYIALRDNPYSVIKYLKPLKPIRELYYEIRNKPSRGKLKKAAEFIYLNKTCWNGLYRVNSKGHFNVPFGTPRGDSFIDFDNLRACSKALTKQLVNISSCDFEITLQSVEEGDLVYLDPPYVNRNGNGFISYNDSLFSLDDQKRLAKTARQLEKMGAYVIVSNTGCKDITELYKGFEIKYVSRTSTLAADPKRRVKVQEVLLYSSNCVGEQ